MVQIVKKKKKKKGGQSKADLARRLSGDSQASLRRSRRRTNARYSVVDYDDFFVDDEEEFDEDEDENRRREKKLRLVVKLSRDEAAAAAEEETARRARGGHAPPDAEDDEESEGERKRKKRRIDGIDDGGDEDDDGGGDDNGDGDGDENDGVCAEDDYEEERARRVDTERPDSVPGTPTEARTAIRLPDKKALEMILDKLQKKDTYGVYAEPVDPEELPDYHDVIEHPMDFATVRKRLSDGSYSTLEQLESDVFLICSNAMQYNSPDTVYHKQARAIQELGRKKFDKLRTKFENSEKEMKLAQKLKSNSMVNKFESSEEEMKLAQKIKSNSAVKKQIKKPLYRTSQETVGSDFSSGATLATAGEILNSMNITQAGGCDKPINNDVTAEVLNDVNLEKAEETSPGKGFLSKLGRKPIYLDDNRRGTYNISTQPVEKPESVFTTFESEIKQLVAVGLHAEYAYARSLARFAATIGPIAWKVASQRIEQALPAGCKFGRGWVGEYEPLPTPVLLLESDKQKQTGLVTKNNSSGETRKNERAFKTPVPVKEKADIGHFPEGRRSLFVSARGPQSDVKPSAFSSTGPQSEAKSSVFSPAGPQSEPKPSAFSSAGPRSEAKPSAFSSTGRKSNNTAGNAVHQHQNAKPRSFPKPEINLPKHVELNDLPTPNQKKADIDSEKPFSRNSETAASKSRDSTTRHANLPQSAPFKLPDSNVIGSAGLPNGKDARNSADHRMNSPSDSGPNHMARGSVPFPHGQNQGISDPVQLMKALAEKTTQKPQNSSDQQKLEAQAQQALPPAPSARRDDPNNAAAAAARVWMSIGAGAFKQPAESPLLPQQPPKSQISADSLYNPARESQFQSQTARVRGEFPVAAMHQFQPDRNGFPVPAFFPHPMRFGNEALHFQNRPIMFPQLASADLSWFQMQSPWHGLSPNHAQPRQKPDTLPPDLNINFQPPQSPVKQSSGIMVESQQPDLALQL